MAVFLRRIFHMDDALFGAQAAWERGERTFISAAVELGRSCRAQLLLKRSSQKQINSVHSPPTMAHERTSLILGRPAAPPLLSTPSPPSCDRFAYLTAT